MEQEDQAQVGDGNEVQAGDADEVTKEEGEEEEEETRIDVTIPYCRFSLGSELYFVKMPNFLSIERKPFDPSLYEDEMEEDEVLDEEGRARLKLKVHIGWQLMLINLQVNPGLVNKDNIVMLQKISMPASFFLYCTYKIVYGKNETSASYYRWIGFINFRHYTVLELFIAFIELLIALFHMVYVVG